MEKQNTDKHRLQITLTEKLYQRVKEVAEMQSVSISALCNIALTEYVRKEQLKEQPPSK